MIPQIKSKTKVKSKLDLNETAIQNFNQQLSNINWETASHYFNSIETIYDNFENKILDTFHNSFEYMTIKINPN